MISLSRCVSAIPLIHARPDIRGQEINNKFTISLGDLKTEIEQAKWDATRRAISEYFRGRGKDKADILV